MKTISYLILKMMGWRVTHPMPEGIHKAVVIMAPHTSNWDFLIGKLGLLSHGVKIKTLIKKESFFFPLGIILKALGAIPVDRGMSAGTIKKVTNMMNATDKFFLLITPEGTRKL
ncbi:MAG: 1-acyl-sn-glycerol-3-phosphate acyltransferase, partial [Bacteroidota bacterium]